jgi:hypothetical protein
MLGSLPVTGPLGPATISDDELAEIVGLALGRPARIGSWGVQPVPYEPGSPATGALMRVVGTTDDGQAWSLFLKVLQHPRHWPLLHLLPPGTQQEFSDTFPWRAELVAWEPAFAGRLPAGMRVPRRYRLDELPDDRVAIWMEDVRTADAPWDLGRFRQAARLLGGLAALRSDTAVLATSQLPAGYGLRRYHERNLYDAFPMLERDDVWAHPLLASNNGRLRADLAALAPRTGAILDRLDELPQALPHGDASPQNLLVPADQPDTLVAIDVSFQCPLAVGFDLGQLLVGLVHASELPASALPEVHAVLVPSFLEGLQEHGGHATAAEVAEGYVGSLTIRSGFTSLPFERLATDPTPALAKLFAERAALTRFIVDLGLALP